MQVSKGNILISMGMLYNPNVAYDQIFGSQCKHYPYHSYIYIFPLPPHIYAKIGKLGSTDFLI